MHWYLVVLRKYATFSGRAGRKEYWMYMLVTTVLSLLLLWSDHLLGTVSEESGSGVLSALYGMAVLLPGLAVTVRRLHDTGRSGWWLMLSATPLLLPLVLRVDPALALPLALGPLALTVLMCLPSSAKGGRFEVAPKQPESSRPQGGDCIVLEDRMQA